ncbi:MAG TPA: hypothetical protein VNW04_14195, partial [Puia sp.]|nr:hypothetical protein [Puia sp.]
MSKKHLRLLFLGLVFLGTSCRHRSKTMSFYYWRTSFAPDSLERQTLRDNTVNTLFIRYFDVDWTPDDTLPRPITP